MSDNNKFRVWVGCLACYNDGRLVGEWFDAEDAPTEADEFMETVKVRCSGFGPPHEELWVFDTDCSPIDGEMSPGTAKQYGEWLATLDDDDDREAFGLFLKEYLGGKIDDDSVSEFEDHKIGFYDGGYWGDSFVAEGWADDALSEQRDSAIAMVNEWSRHDYQKYGRDFVVELLESWCGHVKATQYAWEAECNGEISALRMSDGRAFVYRPYN